MMMNGTTHERCPPPFLAQPLPTHPPTIHSVRSRAARQQFCVIMIRADAGHPPHPQSATQTTNCHQRRNRQAAQEVTSSVCCPPESCNGKAHLLDRRSSEARI